MGHADPHGGRVPQERRCALAQVCVCVPCTCMYKRSRERDSRSHLLHVSSVHSKKTSHIHTSFSQGCQAPDGDAAAQRGLASADHQWRVQPQLHDHLRKLQVSLVELVMHCRGAFCARHDLFLPAIYQTVDVITVHTKLSQTQTQQAHGS